MRMAPGLRSLRPIESDAPGAGTPSKFARPLAAGSVRQPFTALLGQVGHGRGSFSLETSAEATTTEAATETAAEAAAKVSEAAATEIAEAPAEAT